MSLDAYEVKEFIDNQNTVIENLTELVRIMTYKKRLKDEELCSSVRVILNQITNSSYDKNYGEDIILANWKKKPIKSSIEHFCKVLKIDIGLFYI